MVAGKEARLQLADPVPALGQRQLPVTGETTLHPKLVKLLIVKATEIRRGAAERPNEPELRGDGVNGKTEPHLPRKRETTLRGPVNERKRRDFGDVAEAGKLLQCGPGLNRQAGQLPDHQ